MYMEDKIFNFTFIKNNESEESEDENFFSFYS